jgi:DNA-binding NarL/FixJ family response regulator
VPIKVVLAEDSYLVREGVRRLLEHEPDIELVAVCEDYDSLLEAIAGTEPDVLLTDIRMPPTGTDEGVRAAERLRQLRPTAGVVLLSQYADPAYALAFLEGGTEGRAYLLKERVADLDQLLAAIREVARGGSVIDPKVVEALVAGRSRNAQSPQSPLDRLTPREREVLALLAEGRSNAAVADGLVLSERAVEKHINSIFAKLGLPEARDAHRRVKAVLLFLAEQR